MYIKKLISVFALLISVSLLTGCATTMNKLTRFSKNMEREKIAHSPRQEDALGKMLALSHLKNVKPVRDRKALEYINKLGQYLALYSELPDTYAGYHFMIDDDNDFNALAAPGGYIFISKGMIGLTQNESELAAILAHEIVHVQNLDALLALDAANKGYDPSYIDVKLKKTGGLFDVVINQINKANAEGRKYANETYKFRYGQDQEELADWQGKEILAAAGYDPRHMDVFLQRLRSNKKFSSSDYSSTHPSAKDRLWALGTLDKIEEPTPDSPERNKRYVAAFKNLRIKRDN